MKEKITSLVLVLVVAMSMTVGASAASYIPDDVTYQNLNGQQLAIKTYTLLPDQDPADLYEEDFEHDGFLYSMGDIIKEEQHFQEENLHTEVVTVTTASKNLEDILAELKPTIEFDDGISSGTLSLDHSTIKTEAAGYSKTSGGMSNMGRFINLGIAIVNTSYIIRVEMESDGRAEIYMSDGTMFRCDHFDASQLYGTNEKKEGATSLHLQEELRYDQSHSMST